ncbi:unnamed protein product [Amoebophrya sp. A25]|nr:unnamed protein product [Amoebophrya sp. A25]|eukprot:GSA25T00008690001.1
MHLVHLILEVEEAGAELSTYRTEILTGLRPQGPSLKPMAKDWVGRTKAKDWAARGRRLPHLPPSLEFSIGGGRSRSRTGMRSLAAGSRTGNDLVTVLVI